MTPLLWLLGFVIVQRLAELAYARRNERRLLATGGVEVGRGHYPLIVALHVAWIAAMTAFIPLDTPLRLPWLVAFIVLQALRLWTIASLGRFWTTRVITLPGAALVRRGPYRFLRHPNYLIVAAEIAVLPLAFGAWHLAAIFTIANAALLWWRVRIENAALDGRRVEP
ncbi:MAG: isoprenylcysteine carboxylmethyltransferase family protein [Rhodospirillaceae bacterium]|nr:isoprenylcysteine carboxylmethyltransferase family protein [Rhodospirillaceae bacterium]